MIRAVLVLALVTGPALAAPPPVDSDDYRIMHPQKEWVEDRHIADDKGHSFWCCNFSDGRPVDVRIDADGHWQAHVTPAHWPGVVDQWITIPDEKVLRGPNPVGVPILWLNVPHLIGHSLNTTSGIYGGSSNYVEGPVDTSVAPTVFCFSPVAGT